MRIGGVKLWAVVISIVVHLIVLAVFGFAKFSKSATDEKPIAAPTGKIRRIKKLAESELITPKPKIKRSTENRSIRKIARAKPTNQIFERSKPRLQKQEDLPGNRDSSSGFSLAGESFSPKVEFFGSLSDQRKICYVVDCSGSMQGMFGRVQKELQSSIESLVSDQYFCIIFFGSDRLFEFDNGRLVRATKRSINSACKFIDSMRPSGRTNAFAALERAVKIGDRSRNSPSVIYFLTDGFELADENSKSFSQKIKKLLKRFAPETKINTIGFWPQREDRMMLEIIAVQSGGEFVSITDGSGR